MLCFIDPLQYYPIFMKKFRLKLFDFIICDLSDVCGTVFADIRHD